MGKWMPRLVICCLYPVTALAQTLTSINPNNSGQSQRLTVTIVGQNTRFQQGSGTTFVRLARGSSNIISAYGIRPSSNTSLNAEFELPRAAAAGLWDVQVQTSLDGLMTLANGFTINLGAPQDPNATAVSGAFVNLTWTDRSDTEQGYKIERKIGTGGTFQQVAAVGANVTSFQDHPLSALTTYCYRVRAYSGNDNSRYSGESCATTLDQARLISIDPSHGEQSQRLTVNILGENTNFIESSSAMSVHLVRGSTMIAASNFTPLSHASLNAQFDLPATAIAGLWTVQVQSNIDGQLILQNGFTIDLGSPADFIASPVAGNEILLQWSDRSGTEQGFKIERKPGVGGAFEQIATVPANATSFHDRGLTESTQYCYRIRTYSGADSSAFSNQSCATTLAQSAISGVNPAQATQTQTLTLTITGRNTHFAQGSGTRRVWLAQDNQAIEATSYTALDNTTIRADFSIPATAPSGSWDVFVQSGLDGVLARANAFTISLATPSQLLATVISSAQIYLSWRDNSGTEKGYRLERKRGVTGVYQEIDTVMANTTAYSDSGLEAAAEYCYRVHAFDLTSVSSYSDESCDTTAVISFVDASAALPGVRDATAAWGDYDNDGDLDILLCGDPGPALNYQSFTKIYRNENGNFLEAIELPAIVSGSATWGDYDSDNDLDVLVTGINFQGTRQPVSKIFENRNNNFVEVEEDLTGVWGGSASWGDFDNDGDLDLVLSGFEDSNTTFARIYRREASGFVNSGLAIPAISGSIAWGDYDLDSDLDLLMAGKNSSFIITRVLRNETAANQGFVDIAADLPGVMGGSAVWGDYNNDGDLDILLHGNDGAGFITRIYRNDQGTFRRTVISIPGAEGKAAWGDYDNDGDLDLLLAGRSTQGPVSRVYRNDRTAFVDIKTILKGVASAVAATWGDYDNDGDLDILLAGESFPGVGTDPVALVYRNIIAATNTPPEPPGNLSTTVTGNSVSFAWNKSEDLQTPRPGLTCNLRIGTAPGGQNVLSPVADAATGYRRLPALGNVGHRNSWTIKNLPSGTYYWSVQTIDPAFAGSTFTREESLRVGTTAVAEEPAKQVLPVRFELLANYPNPFNPATVIAYALPEQREVRLEIFDHLGRSVRTLVHGYQNPNYYAVTWDGRNDDGEILPSGIYLYRLTAGKFVRARKMLFLK